MVAGPSCGPPEHARAQPVQMTSGMAYGLNTWAYPDMRTPHHLDICGNVKNKPTSAQVVNLGGLYQQCTGNNTMVHAKPASMLHTLLPLPVASALWKCNQTLKRYINTIPNIQIMHG